MDTSELQDLAEFFGYDLEDFQNVPAAIAAAKLDGILTRAEFDAAIFDGTIDVEYRPAGMFLTINGEVA